MFQFNLDKNNLNNTLIKAVLLYFPKRHFLNCVICMDHSSFPYKWVRTIKDVKCPISDDVRFSKPGTSGQFLVKGLTSRFICNKVRFASDGNLQCFPLGIEVWHVSEHLLVYCWFAEDEPWVLKKRLQAWWIDITYL
jgi:hypothetical protein